MLKTTDLSYTYDNGTKLSFPNVTLKAQEHLLILGQSGVGKTTLMYLMAGLLPPSTGEIVIGDQALHDLTRLKRDKFIGEHIGLVFQQYQFINSLKVYDNLLLRLSYPKKQVAKNRIHEIAERLGLSDQLDKKVTSLSQGQQQRLAIALGLIHKPTIIFADEPTSNLDDVNCSRVISLLKEEAELSKSTLVIITHDLRVKSHFKNHIEL